MNKNLFNKIAFGILISFIVLIPFNAFLVTFLSSLEINIFQNFGKIFLGWKEILLIILGFLFLGKWIKNKKFPIQDFFLFDKIFLGFFLIAIFPVFYKIFFGENFLENRLIQAILGFRLDFIYFILFYLIRGFNFDFIQIKKLFYIFIGSGLISLIFGFSLYSQSFNRIPEKIITSKDNFINLIKNNPEKEEFLKKFYLKNIGENGENINSDIIYKKNNLSEEDFLELKNFFENHEQINFRNENFLNLMVDLGYSAGVSNYEVDKSLPAFHIVEAKGTARFASTFAGPNQLGFFLMVFIGLILGFLKFLHRASNSLEFGTRLFYEKIFLIGTIIFSLICLYFSFSRSAWLGIIGIFGLFTFFSFPKKFRLKIFFGGLFLGIGLIFYTYFFQSDFFERTILRGGSTSMHIEKTLNGIEIIKENPMGLGLGMAGPVTMKFSELGEEKIAENWFVQMFQEFGILGGVVYLLFIGSFLIFLIRSFVKNNFENFLLFGGFLGLSGILIAGLFLHSFEDIGVSFLLFLFLGIGLFDINKKTNNLQKKL